MVDTFFHQIIIEIVFEEKINKVHEGNHLFIVETKLWEIMQKLNYFN